MKTKKKLLIVTPSCYSQNGKVVKAKKAYAPMRTPYYLAALTPESYDIKIVDELVEDLDFDADVDLVALTGMLHSMPRMIEISSKFRQAGKTVVAGGVGVYAIRDELKEQMPFSSIAIGEAEVLWKRMLDDFEHRALQPVYVSDAPAALEQMPFARYDLIKRHNYMKSFIDRNNPLLTLETSRGCPHACKFCLVSRYFGRKMRYRPIGEVVDELQKLNAKFVFFSDDNILVNPSRAHELFQALKKLRIKWTGSFDCTSIKYPELLRAACESGCLAGFIGMESLLPENFDSVDKRQNTRSSFEDIVKGFRDAGIVPILHIIFGMKYDTPESIEWTYDKLIRSKIECVIPWILTPIPSTPLHDEMQEAGRLLHRNYSLYDSVHCVMRPESIAPEQLERSVRAGMEKFYSRRNMLNRLLVRRDLPRMLNVIPPAISVNMYLGKLVRMGLHPNSGIAV